MGDLPKGAAATPEVSKELKAVMKPADLQSMVIPPAKAESKSVKMSAPGAAKSVDGKPPLRTAMSKAEKKADNKTIKQSTGGAAARLLPESVKEDAKDDSSTTPLLSENDARCYAARFSDLKGNSGLTHYATVGVPQGRLGTCAKTLTDYEAQLYLETFPELAQKMGRDTPGALAAAKTHYQSIGYLNSHYSAPMKADSK